MNDDELAEIMRALPHLGVTLHVGGTDDRPRIEVRNKSANRNLRYVLGGIELNKRIELYNRQRVAATVRDDDTR